ncbi:MAG: dimethylmenaquinone methyltransferase [Acidobacteria bacterium]|nr:MAG: dimethylmenaquinone methyltransferase [Acidobacteriota bacterium]
MDNPETAARFASLSTPLVADAVLRAGLRLQMGPFGIRPATGLKTVAGRALPVRHFGSVDVFLEAFETARPGDVLVIDNHGRLDEACIGDLTALEARLAGLAGILVWGVHRDTPELQAIPIAVFSLGTCSAGPRRLDASDGAWETRFGDVSVSREDFVFADADGVVFVEESGVAQVLSLAETIASTERRQADAIRAGKSLRDQLRFSEYLEERKRDRSYTLRRHLQKIGGAIEV